MKLVKRVVQVRCGKGRQVMSGDAKPKPELFVKSLAIGLSWGAFGATALMCCALLFEAVSSTQPINGAIYVIVAIGTAVGAAFAAVVTAPIAGLLAWPLYRRGVRVYTAYALAGAGAALPLAILFLLSKDAALESGCIRCIVDFLGWFAASGAFGGFMAARALRRNLHHDK
jgi:hypothetical protein